MKFWRRTGRYLPVTRVALFTDRIQAAHEFGGVFRIAELLERMGQRRDPSFFILLVIRVLRSSVPALRLARLAFSTSSRNLWLTKRTAYRDLRRSEACRDLNQRYGQRPALSQACNGHQHFVDGLTRYALSF